MEERSLISVREVGPGCLNLATELRCNCPSLAVSQDPLVCCLWLWTALRGQWSLPRSVTVTVALVGCSWFRMPCSDLCLTADSFLPFTPEFKAFPDCEVILHCCPCIKSLPRPFYSYLFTILQLSVHHRGLLIKCKLHERISLCLFPTVYTPALGLWLENCRCRVTKWKTIDGP